MLLKYQRHSKHTSAVLSTGICECPLGGAHRASALVAVSTGVLSGCMWATAKPFCQGRLMMFYAKLPWCHKGFWILQAWSFCAESQRLPNLLFILEDLAMTISSELWDDVTWPHLTSELDQVLSCCQQNVHCSSVSLSLVCRIVGTWRLIENFVFTT